MCSNQQLCKECFTFFIEKGSFLSHKEYLIGKQTVSLRVICSNTYKYYNTYATALEKKEYESVCDYKFTGKYAFDFYMYGHIEFKNDFFQIEPYFLYGPFFESSLNRYMSKFASCQEKKQYAIKNKGLPKKEEIFTIFNEILKKSTDTFDILSKYPDINIGNLKQKINFYLASHLDSKDLIQLIEEKKILERNLKKYYDSFSSIEKISDLKAKKGSLQDKIALAEIIFTQYVKEELLTQKEFIEKYKISFSKIKWAENLYRSVYPSQYLRLLKKRETLQEKQREKWNTDLKYFVRCLCFGIEENGVHRDCDILDFLLLFPYSDYKMREIISKSNLSHEERSMLKKFILLYSSCPNLSMRELGSPSTYTHQSNVTTIDFFQKLKILFYLMESNILYPLRSIVFTTALQRYAQSILLKKEKEKNKKLELK